MTILYVVGVLVVAGLFEATNKPIPMCLKGQTHERSPAETNRALQDCKHLKAVDARDVCFASKGFVLQRCE